MFITQLVIALCVVCSGAGLHYSSSCSAERQSPAWETLHSNDIEHVSLALFPLGSIENHGPHLPLGTDLLLAEALTIHASKGLNNVTMLPPSPFGASIEHGNLPGTIPIHDNHLNGLWDDVLSALVKADVHKILLVNGHGGQTPNVEIAIREGRFRYNALIVSFNAQAMLLQAWQKVEKNKDKFDKESVYGIHGGLIETAVMIYLYPNLVKQERASHFKPVYPYQDGPLQPHGAGISFGWRSEDLSNFGALGDASAADVKLGEAIFNETVRLLRQLIAQILHVDHREILRI